ncbi:MAG TPA: metalloregulator ArsR/SmtB family transcription factor [bacterium]|nr:metalloregulator ArsR/SmtB family transcription factor [bacterium]
MSTDQLSGTFAALSDPTRRAMLARLATGEASVQELAKPFHMSLPAISKHLKVLEKNGLIIRRSQAQKRLCKLKTEPIKDAVDWLEHHRKLWEDQLDRLDEYLQELQKKEKENARHKK